MRSSGPRCSRSSPGTRPSRTTSTQPSKTASSRCEAEASVVNLRGVKEIHDELEVRNSWLADDVRERIEDAFKRNVQIAAEGIRIEAVDGTVTLEGTVDSWMERNTAIDAAWTAPGVQDVDDKLVIAG
jgi:osmotically-inducible protein OsmY